MCGKCIFTWDLCSGRLQWPAAYLLPAGERVPPQEEVEDEDAPRKRAHSRLSHEAAPAGEEGSHTNLSFFGLKQKR